MRNLLSPLTPGLSRTPQVCRLLVGCLVFIGACSDPICGCSPVVPTATVVVDGTVHDATSSPVPQAVVSTTGFLVPECLSGKFSMDTEPDSVIADATGHFKMVLSSEYGAGQHCVAFVARAEGLATADTSPPVPVAFRHIFEIPDTAQVLLVAGG